jgi:hypothetical protein
LSAVSLSIAIACSVAWVDDSGFRHWETLKGHEVQDIGDNLLFVPERADVPATLVRDNDCLYLEDPVLKYAQYLRELERENPSVPLAKKKVNGLGAR